MTVKQGKAEVVAIKALLERDEDFVRSAVQCACRGERRAQRRAAWLSERLLPAVVDHAGRLELRVPQDRAGRFSTELFERYQRSEKALVGTLAAKPPAKGALPLSSVRQSHTKGL